MYTNLDNVYCPPNPTPIPAEATPHFEGRLAFHVSCAFRKYDVYVMSANGTNLINLTNHEDNDNHFAWSPDGQKIAFVSDRDGNKEIYIVNADGSELRRLTNNQYDDDHPIWSPDGREIAFLAQHSNSRLGIDIIHPDGSSQRNLVTHPAQRAYDDWPYFAWSYDGKQIAYVSDQAGTWKVHVMTRDGTEHAQVSTTPTDDRYPVWSPDGQWLAFSSGQPLEEKLYIVRSDGSQQIQVANHAGRDIAPEWSPDGRYIAFMSTR